MRIGAPPGRLAVLGGGYIAAELAHVFAVAGSEIVVIEKGDTLLDGQDESITATFTDLMRPRYDLRLEREVTGVDGTPGELRLHLDDDTEIAADALLVAVGRTPNTDRIDAAAGGLDLHDDGRIVVDEYQRVSVDGVFALGDVCTDTPLEHVANREAEIVAHNLRHPDSMRAKGSEPVPAAVFTNPQIASVGLTQAQCRDKGLRYAVGRAEYADIWRDPATRRCRCRPVGGSPAHRECTALRRHRGRDRRDDAGDRIGRHRERAGWRRR